MKKFIVACMCVGLVLFFIMGCSATNSSTDTQIQTSSENSITETSIIEESSIIDSIPLDIPVEGIFKIKEAKYSINSSGQVLVKLKIQIISDLDFNNLSMQTYSYNKDGERIGAHYISVSNLEPDLTVWTQNISTDINSIDEFGSIGIASIRLGNLKNHVSEEVSNIDLDKPIKITVDQITEEK